MEYTNNKVKVIDFFSGCGGTSCGFRISGMEIALALDIDSDSKATFACNFPDVPFLCTDIAKLKVGQIAQHIENCKGNPLLFCGCAPCQPFTKQLTVKPKEKKDQRRSLLYHFGKFVKHYRPEYVFVENVPGIQKVGTNSSPIARFISDLERMKYSVDCQVVTSQSYGVPQRRRRLVLIASRLGKILIPLPTHGPNTDQVFSTVYDWIFDLPAITAGETYAGDDIKDHRSAILSDLNLRRIRAIPPEGSRLDWKTEDLKLKCHSGEHKGHTDVYGRMNWKEPANGLTTRCISLSNGRFGHPEQDRAISVREAACLQTFPREFEFFGNLNSMARQIGNAVPVQLAKVFGTNFIHHFETYQKVKR